ncbi:MAG TPA: hypothetical protein VI259_20875 [Gemmatimonadaceae bacterium]
MPRTMTRAVRALSALLVGASAACYEYREASPTAVRPDEMVHVVLSSDASSSLAGSIGPNATSLDGRVVAVDSGRMRLAVTQIARALGPDQFLEDEPIDLPTHGALIVSVRSMDRPRSALLALSGMVAGFIAVHNLSSSPAIVSTTGAPAGSSKLKR